MSDSFSVATTFRYRKRINDAIGHYIRQVREIWEVHDRPIPVSAEVAAAWTQAQAELQLAWKKADRILEEERRFYRQEQGEWADDGGRNLP